MTQILNFLKFVLSYAICDFVVGVVHILVLPLCPPMLNFNIFVSSKETEAVDEDEDKENNVTCDADSDDETSIRFGTDQVPYAWKNVTKNGWIKKCILVKKKFGSSVMNSTFQMKIYNRNNSLNN